MLGNESPELHPSGSFSAENPGDHNLDMSEGNDYKLFETEYESILVELVDDAMWELCFEVHRAAKLDYFFLKEKKKYKITDNAHEEKDDILEKNVLCPICRNKSSALKFASHLAKCMRVSGRSSSRAASKKIAALTYSDSDENDCDSDSNYNGSRKKAKKNQTKKAAQRRSKEPGNSLSKSSLETNANYQEMTYEKRKEFLNQKCGVISKRTNKMCMNPHKCSQHTDDQRKDVRHFLLRDIGDQLTNDGQIDVDTVDEGSAEFSFMTQ